MGCQINKYHNVFGDKGIGGLDIEEGHGGVRSGEKKN